MSDFIYSRKPVEQGKLSKQLRSIYKSESPAVKEFHGNWGSLAISRNLYQGFQPFETDEHLLIILGGPILTFRDNKFLVQKNIETGSESVYYRWKSGAIQWDEDLSGPFLVLIIDKETSGLICVTDLMSFIPVFSEGENEEIKISSHVDVLARTANSTTRKDLVSQVDFVLHGVITFPYTSYEKIRQLAPATVHTFVKNRRESKPYWTPYERFKYSSIGVAAEELRGHLKNYVQDVTQGMRNVAHFISGGEDSRTIAALLPSELSRSAFVFLDRMNREGEIAKKAAAAYGADLRVGIRTASHYLDILPDCIDLLGSDSEYVHVHTFKFHESCGLTQYPAVFGGLFADALLKGSHVKKEKRKQYPWAPQVKDQSHSLKPINSDVFSADILDKVHERRMDHWKLVHDLRPASSMEWFDLWPSSMNYNVGNIHGNRRLFRSYEPFTSKDVVKLSAAVPQDWKLNRRLFNKMARPLLKPTRWLLHTKGQLPYFPWYLNRFVIFPVNYYRKFTDKKNTNEGPWPKWQLIQESEQWSSVISENSDGIKALEHILKEKDVMKLFSSLGTKSKRRLLQVLHINQRSEQAHQSGSVPATSSSGQSQ